MPYTVRIYPSAKDALQDLAHDARDRIIQAIEEKLAKDPRGPWAVRLNERVWKLRVGPYRVGYRIEEREGEGGVVIIEAVGHRKDIYEDWP